MALVDFMHLHKFARYVSRNPPGIFRVKDLARQRLWLRIEVG